MRSERLLRWTYTFVLLFVTLAWAYFLVIKSIEWAVREQSAVSVVEVAGVSTVLGVLLTLNVNVNQFWFRKRNPDEPDKQRSG